MSGDRTGEHVQVTFQGASDDCIEIDGCPGADEFYVNRDNQGVFRLSSSDGDLLVIVAYDQARNGCWSVGFAPNEEGEGIPGWPIQFDGPLNAYTACVAVRCPADVRLERVS